MPSITSNTPYGIIKDAMFNAGYLQEGQDPNSEQLATNFRRLNDLINLWQTQGLKLFLNREVTVPIVAGQNEYLFNNPAEVPQKPYTRVLQGRVVDPNGTTRPIYPVSWDEWNRLALPATGTITQYLADKQATTLKVKVWNTPSVQEALNTMVFLMQFQIINPINLEQSMEFPQEWRIALCWGLADEISTGQPQAIMDRCEKKASIFREALEDWDVEDAPTMFATDYRMQHETSGFV